MRDQGQHTAAIHDAAAGAAPAADVVTVSPAAAGLAAHRSGRGGGIVASAALGFLVGAVFWHFVGFWGFVREVLLKGPVPEASRVAQTGPQCTALVLDRSSGHVRIDTCPSDAPWLTETPGGGRGDLLTAVRPLAAKRWSVTVQAGSVPEDE